MLDRRYVTAEELARLVDEGRALARYQGRPETDREAVWCLLVEAMDTLRRLPPTEGAKLGRYGSCMPAPVLSRQERFVAAVERAGLGEGRDETAQPRTPPSAAAVRRLEYSLHLLTYLRPGRHLDRNRRILLALAGGATPLQVARYLRRGPGRPLTAPSISNLRAALCGQITREITTRAEPGAPSENEVAVQRRR